MKKIQIILISILLLSLMFTPLIPVQGGSIDDDIKKAEQVKKQLEEQIKAQNALIDSLSSKESQVVSELNKVELQLQRVQGQIDLLMLEIEKTKQEYLTLSADMEALKSSIEQKNVRMKKLLQVLYQNYTMSFNAYLFSAKNLNEIIDKAVYLQYLFEADKTFFRSLKEEKRLLETKKQSRIEIDLKLNTDKSTLDKENTHYLALEKQKSIQIANFAYQIRIETESKEEAVRKHDAIEAYIKALLKKKAEEIRRKNLLNSPFGNGGKIIWPIDNGQVSSPFGMRMHPIFGVNRMHTGVDIDAPSGTPIRAITTGIVVYSGWLSGYGNVVALQHAEGFSSLYAHMRTIYVKEDQSVSLGAVIGEVGTTGWSTEPHLHFEIRLNGEPINPMKYLSPS
ncbi:MAG: peptidoglycan DD-metalloendopeptidase family protein [Caldisericia bacterium]|nr:peptidoglycan DD-metalloendopeptidase family protein [Caldisericia bacterium]